MYELVYCSAARRDLSSGDISAILKTARDFNSENNITGCLLYYNHEFIQVLEGKQEIIQSLFAKINKDDRHFDIMVLAGGDKEKRVFNSWSMAFHELSNEDVQGISTEVFAENFIAFSQFAVKNTFPTILFWSKVCLLLQK